ncbi:hypothetical protein [Mastigocladopsis repens]|nr:hypothetical protein [Mastigocladopsis repens]
MQTVFALMQILTQHNAGLENADYTIPVPTENQTIAHRDCIATI